MFKNDDKGGVLIFTNTKTQCDKLAAQLKENNFKCAIFRGDMDRLERRANLKKFHDGQHKRDSYLVNTLGEFVEWVPVCPEVECGLSIPRPSMHIEGRENDLRHAHLV